MLVAAGDRVAQLILERIVTPEVQEVEASCHSSRNSPREEADDPPFALRRA